MSTWEDRMAQKQAERRASNDAARRKADNERQAGWPEFVSERGGDAAYVTEDGEYQHAHDFHGNVLADAVTGEPIPDAIFSVVYLLPPPASCPICDDFKREEWP